MRLEVEELDPRTAADELLLAGHAVEVACAGELGGRRLFTPAEELAYQRNPPPTEVRRRWLARLDGDVVGTAGLWVHAPTRIFARLFVRPDARRRGAGAALLDAVRAAAAQEGGRSFFTHHASEPGAAFARAVGAVDGGRDIRSELRLADARLVPPRLDDGVELRSWVGPAPEELVASYTEALDAMIDAPTPDGQEDVPWTVEQVRGLEAAVAARGRERRVTVAVAGGRVVATTELRVSAPPALGAQTEDTGTVREWRGRGLATAVKVEALRRLRADRPDVELTDTLNAEENGAMRAINAKLGFRPVGVQTTTVLRL